MADGSRQTLLGRLAAPSPRVERLLEPPPEPLPATPATPRPQTVLFTDIVGSTGYFEQRGDEAGLRMLEEHNALLIPLVQKAGGRVVKTIGDAIMAAFPSPAAAVSTAVAMQQRLVARNSEVPAEFPIVVRIGIHHGPVLEREQDLFGDVVNAAARIESLAEGGQILVAGSVVAALPADFPFPCPLFDAVRVKGKRDPLQIHEVGWDPHRPARRTPAPGAGELPLTPGTRLGGRFEIRELLGQGGMGQVYRAHDHALDVELALKFVRRELARDAEALRHFKQEVRLTRAVTHPGICRIHEFLEMDGTAFLSMELVRGGTLADLLREQGPLPPARAAALVVEIGAGVQAAHQAGIIHRDLKPANVMIEEPTGRVVVMDFGIAQLRGRPLPGEEGIPAGTPEYMAPEQLAGAEVGPAADIYALGAILYELLTGTPPYRADTPVAIATGRFRAVLRRQGRLPATVPPALAAATERCLARDPRDRFPDVLAFTQALGREDPAPARRGRGPGRGLVALLLGLLLLTGVAGGLLVSRGPGDPGTKNQTESPNGPQVIATRPLVSGPQAKRLGRYSPDGQAVAFLREGDLWLLARGEEPRQLTHGEQALLAEGLDGLAWSPDGQQLLFARREGTSLGIARVGLGPDDRPASFLAGAAAIDGSPDGQWLAFAAPNAWRSYGIGLARADGSQRRLLLEGTASRAYLAPRFSPDGTQLVLVVHQVGYRRTRDIGVLTIATGALRLLTDDGITRSADNCDPTWSADGRRVIYSSARTGTPALWEVAATGGPSHPLAPGALEGRRWPASSPDGRRILFSTHQEELDIALGTLTAERERPLTRDLWPDRFPVFSPDGRHVAYRSQRESASLPSAEEGAEEEGEEGSILVLQELASAIERRVTAPAGLRDFDWCPNERIVYAATAQGQRTLGVLTLADGRTTTLVQGFSRVWSPSCSPDGQLVAFCGVRQPGEERQIFLLPMDGGSPRALTAAPGLASWPAWAPDGSRIAYRWAPSLQQLGESELRTVPLAGGPPASLGRHRSLNRSGRRLHYTADGQAVLYLEAVGRDARLWRQPVRGGEPEPLGKLPSPHTFDFDLAADGTTLVYPRAERKGDLFQMELAAGAGPR